MGENFTALGFTSYDGFMFALCIMLAAISGSVDYILKRADLVTLKVLPEDKMSLKEFFPLVFGRLLVSILAGFVVWLLFVGVIPYTKEGVVRYMIFSLAAGFVAPSVALKYRDRLAQWIVKSSGVSDNKS